MNLRRSRGPSLTSQNPYVTLTTEIRSEFVWIEATEVRDSYPVREQISLPENLRRALVRREF
jgi:hypothetical protein